jgi:hypothetical protein
MADQNEQVAANTDREIWRKGDGDGNGMSHYEPSIHVTQDGRIGINVGGNVHELPVEEWHEGRAHIEQLDDAANAMLDALLLIQSNERGESYSAGVAMSCIASLDEKRKAQERRGRVPRFLPTWLGGEADRVSGSGIRLPKDAK